MASRFKDLDVSVEDFISEQENESTKKKTLQNVAKDKQEEYEPSSLRRFIASFERYLKKKNYGHSIIKSNHGRRWAVCSAT